MSWEHDLFSILEDKSKKNNIMIGNVVNIQPLQIKIHGLTLDSNDLILNESLIKHVESVDIKSSANFALTNNSSLSPTNVEITTHHRLKTGDDVVIFPFADSQLYFVAAKGVRV